VLGQIQKAIHKVGDDTPQLLDYVYLDSMVKNHISIGFVNGVFLCGDGRRGTEFSLFLNES
jgi:hypothetical protein